MSNDKEFIGGCQSSDPSCQSTSSENDEFDQDLALETMDESVQEIDENKNMKIKSTQLSVNVINDEDSLSSSSSSSSAASSDSLSRINDMIDEEDDEEDQDQDRLLKNKEKESTCHSQDCVRTANPSSTTVLQETTTPTTMSSTLSTTENNGAKSNEGSSNVLNSDTRRRVKLYMLNANRTWDDRGTGHVSSSYIDRLNGMSLLVKAETDGSTLLESKIMADTAYQKQQDTLIVWSEGENYDLALSFQERIGCEEIWAKICQVQGKDPSVDITQDLIEDEDNGISL